MNILVCDDNPMVKMMTSTILKALGHHLEIASDGVDAFQKILSSPIAFNLLITDNLMPRLTGVELVEKIRALKLPLKVIMITGFPTELKAEVKNQPRIDGFLTKPFKPNDLLKCLKKIGC